MRRVHVALALTPLVLLAGCGGSPATPGRSPAPTVTVTVTASPPASRPPSPPSAEPSPGETGLTPPTNTEEIKVERPGGVRAIVTGARFARHRGFDRVVIDLRGGVPGYTVRRVSGLFYDGSGEPVPVKGGAYLQVTMSTAQAHTESGSPTWPGGPVYRAGLGNVRNVVRTGDFEGVVGVGLVLDRRAAFRVTEQAKPYRLVVDVAH
ncbi:hypothetical protein GCM10017673_41010 [Streptosporangium violaceochromogenes]|nr:hypothetical protein GCM10017673_41010 [Streptosporangium violaceochromogenes]